MPSEFIKRFLQSGGVMRITDIGFLFNSDISKEDIEYMLQYIDENLNSTIHIHMDAMMSIARNVLQSNEGVDIVNKFINEESVWTPYLLGTGLIINRYFPDKLGLYRKYSYQIFLMTSITYKSILGPLQVHDDRSVGITTNFSRRLTIKCYIDNLDHITLNRLELIIDDLLRTRDKYEISKFLSVLFHLKDVNTKMKEYLHSFILEFCDPKKRRCYSSAFLRGLYEYMSKEFRFNFHNYVESLYEEGLISNKDFTRYDRAYLESSEI